MEKSASAEPRQLTVPRWALLVAIAVSCALAAWQFVGAPCDNLDGSCSELWGALSWSVAVFPNSFAFPLAFTGIPKVALILGIVAANLMVGALIWRTQPAQLGIRRLMLILLGWICLSAATAWYAPGLARPLYDAFH